MTVEQDFQLQLHLHFGHFNYTSVLQSEQKVSWEWAAHISAHFGSATGKKVRVCLKQAWMSKNHCMSGPSC